VTSCDPVVFGGFSVLNYAFNPVIQCLHDVWERNLIPIGKLLDLLKPAFVEVVDPIRVSPYKEAILQERSITDTSCGPVVNNLPVYGIQRIPALTDYLVCFLVKVSGRVMRTPNRMARRLLDQNHVCIHVAKQVVLWQKQVSVDLVFPRLLLGIFLWLRQYDSPPLSIFWFGVCEHKTIPSLVFWSWVYLIVSSEKTGYYRFFHKVPRILSKIEIKIIIKIISLMDSFRPEFWLITLAIVKCGVLCYF
jgi:hypothetical protein